MLMMPCSSFSYSNTRGVTAKDFEKEFPKEFTKTKHVVQVWSKMFNKKKAIHAYCRRSTPGGP
jgi:hypothetical protein